MVICKLVLKLSIALGIVASVVLPAYAAPSVADTRFGIAEGFRNPSVMAEIGAG